MQTIGVDLRCREGDPYRTIDVHVGSLVISVYEGTRYIVDSIIEDGKCRTLLPSRGTAIFLNHNLHRLTEEDNPEVFALIRKAFAEADDSDFEGSDLDCRSTEVVLEQDKTINALLHDRAFKRLSREVLEAQ